MNRLHVDLRVADLHCQAVRAMCERRLVDAVKYELQALDIDPEFEEAETVIAWALKCAVGKESTRGFELYI